MKHFFIRLIFFVSPITLVAFLIIASALYLGDMMPVPVMVSWQQQSDTPVVYQPWSAGNLVNYKFRALQETQPQVMIMGSSRMTLFRAALANHDPSRFYNAGIPSSNVLDWQPFLEQVIASGHIPDVIILGLDLSNYNGDVNMYGAVASPAEISLIDNARYSYASLRRVSRMWVSDTSDMLDYTQRVYQTDVILAGLQVLTSGRGFLRDGSRYVVDIESTLPAILEREANNFEQRQGYFSSGHTVSERAMVATQSILELTQANDITVIGILPPYRPSYYESMMASGDFEYMPLAVDALQELFDDYAVPFVDYTDPRIMGGSEAEMTDSWHFTDLLSLRIYHDLLTRHPEILAEFSDAEALSTWLTAYQDYSLDLFMVDLP